MNIVKYPDPRLRQVCAPFSPEEVTAIQTGAAVSDGVHETPTIRIGDIANAMLALLPGAGGIGLAAPQVGIMRRLIVVNLSGVRLVLLNPEITSAHGTQGMKEGCLSYPGRRVFVQRAKTIQVSGLDANGQPVARKASGMLATVIQHELDHLDGVCRVAPTSPGGNT